MVFELHERLEKDSIIIGRFNLCLLLRIKDDKYPWYVLVPERESIKEIHQLNDDDRLQYFKESLALSEAIESYYRPDKMNVAALGNMVPQLHVHHVARFKNDKSWPDPIWGKFPLSLGDLDAFKKESFDFASTLHGFHIEG